MSSLTTALSESPLFSYSYLAAVNLITCGTELCSSAAFSYLPPLLLEAGFSESGMSSVMAMGPFLALFLLPIMGMASDQCHSRYGRRRPFILLLSLGIIISLILLPNGKNIAAYFKDYVPERHSSLILLAFAVILLDFCSQVTFTPIESLLSDPCQTEFQRNRSFGVFSLMMSIGSCFGYWVVSVNWNETPLGNYFGGHERTLFDILLVLFSLSLVVSIYVAIDPPLHSIENGAKSNVEASHDSHKLTGNILPLPGGGNVTAASSVPNGALVLDPPPTPKKPFHRIFSKLRYNQVRCLSLLCSFRLPRINMSPITDTIKGMRTMPKVLKKLWTAHLMTSMAVMGFRLYFTDYVGESIFHGNPDSPAGSLSRIAYENGIRSGSFGLLLHSILSAIFSVVIGPVITNWGAIGTYMFGMVTFTVATFLMLFVDGITLTLLLAGFTGLANATVTTVPYTLLTGFHQKKEAYLPESDSSHSDLHGKGADLALLDSAYILSEVISSFAFGVIVEMTKTTEAYIVCSFACSLVSCFLIHRVK